MGLSVFSFLFNASGCLQYICFLLPSEDWINLPCFVNTALANTGFIWLVLQGSFTQRVLKPPAHRPDPKTGGRGPWDPILAHGTGHRRHRAPEQPQGPVQVRESDLACGLVSHHSFGLERQEAEHHCFTLFLAILPQIRNVFLSARWTERATHFRFLLICSCFLYIVIT